jgi:hypothetical protein
MAVASPVAESSALADGRKPDFNASEIHLVEPAPGAEVSQLHAAQKAYLQLPREERVRFFADAEKRKKLAHVAGFHPKPVSFS